MSRLLCRLCARFVKPARYNVWSRRHTRPINWPQWPTHWPSGRCLVKLTEQFLDQLAAEATRTRRALERVPEGRDDWKPHDKSMPFGRLAALVARMPSWISLIVNRDELDLNPAGGSNIDQRPLRTSRELVQAHDEGVAG